MKNILTIISARIDQRLKNIFVESFWKTSLRTLMIGGIIFSLSSTWAVQKGKYSTNKGKISFFSSTSLESAKAVNAKVYSVLDTKTGTVVLTMHLKDFVFPQLQMQEHFNDHYMTSEVYPKSVFNGKITNLKEVTFNRNGFYNVSVEGELLMHQVTKQIKLSTILEVRDGKILVKGTFPVQLKDHELKLPDIVSQNVVETVAITLEMVYEPGPGLESE